MFSYGTANLKKHLSVCSKIAFDHRVSIGREGLRRSELLSIDHLFSWCWIKRARCRHADGLVLFKTVYFTSCTSWHTPAVRQFHDRVEKKKQIYPWQMNCSGQNWTRSIWYRVGSTSGSLLFFLNFNTSRITLVLGVPGRLTCMSCFDVSEGREIHTSPFLLWFYFFVGFFFLFLPTGRAISLS